jgi:hypothetical protein
VTRVQSTLVACGLALLVLTGCSGDGGGDRDAAPASSTAPAGPTTAAPAPAPSPTFTGQGSAEFCALARTYTERSATVGSPSAMTPSQLRSLANEGRTAITQAARTAPPEIKADVELISNTFTALLTELEKVNYDFAKITPVAFAPLQTPEFGRASQRFQAYTRDVCKIS